MAVAITRNLFAQPFASSYAGLRHRVVLDLCGPKNYPGIRTLLSDSNLSLDQYVRQRIFKTDELGPCGKENLLNKLKSVNSMTDSNLVAFDVTDLIHVAETEAELSELERLVRLISCSPVKDVTSFRFGASLMRLYHHLNIPERAYSMSKDEVCNDLLKDNTCHKILMDLLYRNEQYGSVIAVFSSMTHFNIDCTTLASGAYYHLNTPVSAEASMSLVRRLLHSHTVSQRSLLYSAMLCLNQNKTEDALECLKLCKKNALTLNLELILQALGHRMVDILVTLQKAKERSEDTTNPLGTRLYSDTMDEVKTCLSQNGNADQLEQFAVLEKQLSLNGALSRQTLKTLLDRTIMDGRNLVKNRGKRKHIT